LIVENERPSSLFCVWLLELKVYRLLTDYFLSILAYIGDEDNMEVRIIAGATVAVVVVLVVVIIMTVLFLRRCVFFILVVAILDLNLLTK